MSLQSFLDSPYVLTKTTLILTAMFLGTALIQLCFTDLESYYFAFKSEWSMIYHDYSPFAVYAAPPLLVAYFFVQHFRNRLSVIFIGAFVSLMVVPTATPILSFAADSGLPILMPGSLMLSLHGFVLKALSLSLSLLITSLIIEVAPSLRKYPEASLGSSVTNN